MAVKMAVSLNVLMKSGRGCGCRGLISNSNSRSSSNSNLSLSLSSQPQQHTHRRLFFHSSQQPRIPIHRARWFSTAPPTSSTPTSTTPSSTPANSSETHFGFTSVATHEKQEKVNEVFARVAGKYDLMNDVMSAGVHRLWKECFVSMINPTPGASLLDVAGGTGDISFRYIEALRARAAKLPAYVYNPLLSPSSGSSLASPHTLKPSRVVVTDINPSMLEVGKDRARSFGYLTDDSTTTAENNTNSNNNETKQQQLYSLEFATANAEQLPFADNSFDTYTIAFGLRNVTQIDKAIFEALRVLKPGGRFMCLEFSKVVDLPLLPPVLSSLYDVYSFNVIPWMGQVVAEDRASYQYLVESIRNFPPQDELKELMQSIGFKRVTYTNLTFGVAAIHSGFKL